MLPHSSILASIILWSSATVQAYIPATPTNDTQDAIQHGLNVTDVSTLSLSWYANGESNSSSINVCYWLAGTGSNGVSKGAFVHFSEQNLTDETTITPWIALVSCDANSTDGSLSTDIFTLARDRGAVAGLLYSNYSFACVINSEYTNSDHVFDIFSTQSLATSRLIENRFSLINQSIYGDFDPLLLNETFSTINNTITNDTSIGPGYMFATLRAYNATQPDVQPSTTNAGSPRYGGTLPQEMKTSLVIIVCVSTFLITN